jgi:UPF0042 nucleotide-binding protein
MKRDKAMQLVIITGMSGAGKTVAIQSLEDMEYYCVDNLPPVLIQKFIDLMQKSSDRLNKVALFIDLRSREFFGELTKALSTLDRIKGIDYRIIFLEADDVTLVNRYKESRRKHPVFNDASPLEGIRYERQQLEEIKGKANHIIDTSHLAPRELKEKVTNLLETEGAKVFTVNVQSFGFKYGVPLDTDLMFDVRFLPNPHYVDTLREKTGKEQEVFDYVMKWQETGEFLDKLVDLLKYLLPKYKKEGKSQLHVAIGCTGGKHRSVVVADQLLERLGSEWAVNAKHRDIMKDRKQSEKADR